MKINQEIKTHFEYLGYAVVPNENAEENIFMKPGMPTVFVQQINKDRLVLNVVYEYNKNGSSNRLGLLEFVNHLNMNSWVSTFSVDSSRLGYCALYTGGYNRIEFGQFMEAFEQDSTTLFDKTPETQIFLVEDCPKIDSDLMNLAIDKQYAA